MSTTDSNTGTQSMFTGLPSGVVPIIAILAALVSAFIHLSLAPMVLQFNTVQGILFILSGLGFIGGIILYLTKYWRRELYLVAAVFALIQVVAFFALSGPVNQMSIASKVAEVVFAAAAVYLYQTDTAVTG